MIPSAFVFLDALPLTPNGKLDRRALPGCPLGAEYTEAQREFVAPRTALERHVAAIWQAVLGIDQVGLSDNFFALGGHSLLATQVISRVRNHFALETPLKTLFEAPHLGAFAARISQSQALPPALLRPRIQPRPEAGAPGARRSGPLPLSFAQQRLWFLDQLEPGSALYNIPLALHLRGELDVDALAASFTWLIARHESLRTTFAPPAAEGNGEPSQLIHPPTALTLTPLAVADGTAAQALAEAEATTPFDLQQGPLLRVQLLRLADTVDATAHWLLLTLHHSISDGWSNGVLMGELRHAYTAYVAGREPTLPALPIQYADFALWQRQYLRGETLDRQLTFWRAQLSDAPPLLELPTDRPRPPVQSYRGAHYEFALDAALTARLKHLAQAQEASLFMVLLAAFNVLLARYSRQEEIVVGTPIANRHLAEIEGLIGFFVNTLVLRTSLAENPTFAELLTQVRQTTLAAYDHQDLPFEQLVDALQVERTLSYSPLFQVMLVLQMPLTTP